MTNEPAYKRYGETASKSGLTEVERLIMEKYGDIINLPHHVSQNHPQMPAKNRAAQFASFAALSGYEEAVNETARAVNEGDNVP